MGPSTFTVVTQVQDPLSADRLVAVLQEAGVDSFSRARGAASLDGFAAATPGRWDVLVPSQDLERAAVLINAEMTTMESEGDENARLAEEEMLSGEHAIGEGD